MNTKPILSIETSGEICGASVYFDDNQYVEINLKQKNIHSEKLLGLVDQVLNMFSLRLDDLNAIAVSFGPGSFTGLRIGMSAAKGLAFGANLPIIPVPTFEALAFQICNSVPDDTKFVIANRVNIDEVYFAKYKSHDNNYSAIEEIQVLNKRVVNEKIKDSIIIFGNAEVNVENPIRRISSPNAVWISKWAYSFGKDLVTFDYDFLEPEYFKHFVVRNQK